MIYDILILGGINMEEKINEFIKLVYDLRGTVTLINKYKGSIGIHEQEDGYIRTTLRAMPTVEELDTLVFYLKEKLNKLNQEVLYCIEADIETGKIKTEEVKVLKFTDKLFKINHKGYKQVNKYTDLNSPKFDGDTVFVFTTDKEQGTRVVKSAIHNKIQEIQKQIENYNKMLAQFKNLE